MLTTFGLLALAYQVPASPITVDIGSSGDQRVISGFYWREHDPYGTTYRWAGGQGTVMFSGVGGGPLRLTARLSGFRPAGSARVTLRVNGQPFTTFDAGGDLAPYTFDLPRGTAGPWGDVAVTLESDTFVASPDRRTLGVLVDEVRLEPDSPWAPAWPPLSQAVALGVAVLTLFLWLRWWGLPLWPAVALALALAVAGALGYALARPWLTLNAWPLLVALVGLALLTVILAALLRLLTRWLAATSLSARQVRVLAGVLLLALAVRLPFMATQGYETDVRMYETWSWKAATLGIHTLYEPSAGVTSDNHPGILYPFKAIGWLYQRLLEPDFPFPEQTRLDHRFMLRFPAVLSDLLIGIIAYAVARRRLDGRLAAVVLASFVFNPAIIFDSAYYGQLDAVHSLLVVGSIVLVGEGLPGWGWGVMGVAMLTKPQTYVMVPLLVVITARRSGWRGLVRGGLAGAAGGLLVVLPFLLYGTFGSFVRYMFSIAEMHPLVGVNADNLWWWVTNGQSANIPDSASLPVLAALGLSVSYRLAGLVLALVVLAYACIRAWRQPHPPAIYEWGALSALAFFVLSTEMHENYMYLTLPLLALVYYTERRLTLLYVLLSATFVANMALHYPEIVAWIVPQHPDVFFGAELFWPRFLTAVANTAALACWLWTTIPRRSPQASEVQRLHA